MPISIFIAEDNRDIMDFYTKVMTLYGYKVISQAENGAEAVEKFKSMTVRPDIIIMDHRMPIKDGIEATREILELDPAAKVIVASADASIEMEALQTGAVAFKKKPFTIKRLVSNIETVFSTTNKGPGV